MTLIDLETPTRHRPGGAPVLRMGRALAGRRRREILTIVVAVLVLAVLGGSVVPKTSTYPVPHPVGPSPHRYAIGADFLFTTADDGGSVSAYSLDSGEAVWRLEAPQILSLRAVAGVAIVSVAPATPTRMVTGDFVSGGPITVPPGVTEVFAVDERTGERRWTHPGTVVEGVESGALIVVQDGRALNAYAPVSGELVWRRSFGLFGTAPVADGPPRLLVQEYAIPELDEPYLLKQPLSSVDLASGAVTALGSLDSSSTAMLGLGEPLAVVSSHFASESGKLLVQGGLAAEPEQVWRLAVDPSLFRQSAWACGGLLCTSQGNLTTAINPVSGELVWRADAEWVNHRTMRVGRADLLVAVRRGETGPNTLLLDPLTGQVRWDLANWSPLAEYRGRRLVLWAPDSRIADSWLGYLDSSAPHGVRPLFPIGPALHCSATDRWLFCEGLSGGVQAVALRLDALDRMLP